MYLDLKQTNKRTAFLNWIKQKKVLPWTIFNLTVYTEKSILPLKICVLVILCFIRELGQISILFNP